MDGWYYLHTNGEMIYKTELGGTAADIRESDFSVAMWPIDRKNRETAWRILVEGLAAGANLDRIKEMAAKWQCNDEDADVYAERLGVAFFKDGNQWLATTKNFANLQESSCYGFGDTKLEALVALAKAIGYKPSKMWGASFADLVKQN